jgi:RimJ/RimL family protein N-acetyltransferase
VGFSYPAQEEQTVLEGVLVNLRAPEPGDAEHVHRWRNDRAVTYTLGRRYMMPLPYVESWVEGFAGSAGGFENAHFTIETKDGRVIGDIGLFGASTENREAYAGIMIGEKDCWSLGYGSDALRTLLRFAFGEMNLNRVALHVFDFNPRAIASYRKCGFVEEGRMRQAMYRDGRYHDIVMMAVLREEFERDDERPDGTAGAP